MTDETAGRARAVLALAYELVLGALAVVTVATLFVDEPWAFTLNWVIYGIFALDVTVRFARDTERRTFLRRNWPDIVALIPFELFRPFRTIRLLRLVRLLRAFRLLTRVWETTRGVLRQNGLQYVLGVTVGMIFVGAALVWWFEPGIESFPDALWWAVVTTTTVGYGDIAPEDLAGRGVALVLMIVGVGTLGMITGSIATYFAQRFSTEDIPSDVRYVQERLGSWCELDDVERRRLVALLVSVTDDAAR